jgi:hypothetical protein
LVELLWWSLAVTNGEHSRAAPACHPGVALPLLLKES